MGSTAAKKKSPRVRHITWNTLPERIKKVREKILSAGNTMAGVVFYKRTDDSLRHMSYRLHVQNPKYAAAPSGNKDKWKKDRDNLQLTVLDVNSPIKDLKGNTVGRGQYRTIPLENVRQISVRGQIYFVDEGRRKDS
jgi:hypothetical protein